MPTVRYALERGGDERLELEWPSGFGSLVVRYDDTEIGRATTTKELKDGCRFTLPDGTLLGVRQRTDYFGRSLDIERDGRPLPGSPGALRGPHRLAYRALYLLAGFHLGGGLYLVAVPSTTHHMHPLWVLALGGLYLAFGMATHRRLEWALIVAIVFYAADGARSVVAALLVGDDPSLRGIVLRLVVLAVMIWGIGPTRHLPRKERLVPPWETQSEQG